MFKIFYKMMMVFFSISEPEDTVLRNNTIETGAANLHKGPTADNKKTKLLFFKTT